MDKFLILGNCGRILLFGIIHFAKFEKIEIKIGGSLEQLLIDFDAGIPVAQILVPADALYPVDEAATVPAVKEVVDA